MGFQSSAYSKDIFDSAREGDVENAKKLVAENPDTINSLSPQGYSPLILACYYNRTEFIQFLADNKVKLEATQGKPTALQACAYKGFEDAVAILLKYGADPNLWDPNGTTALIYATQFKHVKIAKMLVEAGADVKYRDPNGNTALDYAKQLQVQELYKVLE